MSCKGNLQLPCYVHHHCATFADFKLHDDNCYKRRDLIWWLWNCANRYVCRFTVHECRCELIGQAMSLFLMSDVLSDDTMITKDQNRKNECQQVSEQQERGCAHISVTTWGSVSNGSETVLLVVSHQCPCLKHLLLSVKADNSCCIQKLSKKILQGHFFLCCCCNLLSAV